MRRILKILKINWQIIFLITVSCIIRIYIFKIMHPIIHTDSITFLFLQEIDMVRTPGYPLFLHCLLSINDLFSLTTDYFKLICFGQMFGLGVLNSYLIYRITVLLTKDKIFALLMSLVYNFNFFVVSFEFQIMTETLSITLLLLIIMAYIQLFKAKKPQAILGGILSVLLLLTKASFILLGIFLPFITFVVYFQKSKNKRFLKKIIPVLALFLIVNLVGIGAWSMRNQVKFGYFGISSLMPYQLRYYTNSFFEKYKPGNDERLNQIAAIYSEELKKTGMSSKTIYNFHQRIYEKMNLSDSEINKAFLKVNLKLIWDYPSEYLKQIPSSFLIYYKQYSPYWSAGNAKKFINNKNLIPKKFRIFFLFYKRLFEKTLILLLIIPPLFLFFWTYKNRKVFHGWIILTAVIHYNCFVSIFSTNAGINNLRYRAPVEPLILLMFYSFFFYLGRNIYCFLKDKISSSLVFKIKKNTL